MRITAFIIFGFLSFGAQAQEKHHLRTEPFNFQNEDLGFHEYYMEGYNQMIMVGPHLHLRYVGDPYVVKINTKTLKGKRIGGQGEGPGRFRMGPAFMAVRGNQIWAVDGGKTNRIMHYVDGIYKSAIPIEPMDPIFSNDGNNLAASDREVVAPVSPRTGHLAMAYGFDGSRTYIGELPFNKTHGDLVFRIPYINQTIWHFGDDHHWYAAFPYATLVYKFDRNFKKVGHFTFEHPVFMEQLASIQEFEPLEPGLGCNPLVTDVKWFRGHLYVMAGGYLTQLDPNSGKIVSLTRFTTQDPKDSHKPGLKIFPMFAFRDDGSLFLGHEASHPLSGHDMHMVRNPSFLK